MAAWKVLYEAQRQHTLAVTGPYARLRHPQYAGFMLILLGFLLQWPTLLTLIMFPILVTMHVWLARREEREVVAETCTSSSTGRTAGGCLRLPGLASYRSSSGWWSPS